MDPFHERLAHAALRSAEAYGFALAGGYAVQVHSFLERPSEDVDLFTTMSQKGRFDEAVEAVVKGLTTKGSRWRSCCPRLALPGRGLRSATGTRFHDLLDADGLAVDVLHVQASRDDMTVTDLEERHPAHLEGLAVATGT